MRRLPLVLATAALAVVTSIGIASADIPAPDGTIHGCYDTQHPFEGAVVVIDSQDTCPAGTQELDWNQTSPPGLASVERISNSASGVFLAANGGTTSLTATCPSGKTVLSGGYSYGGFVNVEAHQSFPASDLSGWTVQLFNSTASQGHTVDLTVYAVCAAVG